MMGTTKDPREFSINQSTTRNLLNSLALQVEADILSRGKIESKGKNEYFLNDDQSLEISGIENDIEGKTKNFLVKSGGKESKIEIIRNLNSNKIEKVFLNGKDIFPFLISYIKISDIPSIIFFYKEIIKYSNFLNFWIKNIENGKGEKFILEINENNDKYFDFIAFGKYLEINK